MNRERISFRFDSRDMLLSHQTGFCFVRAAVPGKAILLFSLLFPFSLETNFNVVKFSSFEHNIFKQGGSRPMITFSQAKPLFVEFDFLAPFLSANNVMPNSAPT